MIRIVCLLGFVLFTGAHAQTREYQLLATLDRQVEYFTTDMLGNAYLVCPEGLFKVSPAGVELAAFDDKSFGRISSVDATDPLKIVLFNSDFRKVSILDDKLAAQSSFDLNDLGVDQPTLVCTSRHDGYWVYDAQSRKLIKFDTGLKKVYEGEILSYKLNHLAPDFLAESAKWIFMNDPANGIIVTDRYGTYFKVIRGVNAPNFQCEGEWLLYASGGSLVRLHASTMVTEELPLPVIPSPGMARLEKNRLYLVLNDSFQIYSF